MKSLLFPLLVFLSLVLNAQNTSNHVFGSPTQEELEMDSFADDPEAAAVVLFEQGDYSVGYVHGFLLLIKNVYRKIKVLDAKKFSGSTVKIQYSPSQFIGEEIQHLEAVTHNGGLKTFVSQAEMYDSEENFRVSSRSFAFPDVRDGSILEYRYQLTSPEFFNLGDWVFMNEYPTLHSELHLALTGNYVYNRTLYGDRNLDINKSFVKPDCFQIPKSISYAACEVAHYAMKNVPAFKEENHMLSARNYIPAIRFELVERGTRGQEKRVFSKTWKDVETLLKYNEYAGEQLKQSSFFRRRLPASVFRISDPRERAEAVYYAIRDHYHFNGYFSFFTMGNLRNSFNDKKGGSADINYALVNALKAARLDAKPVLTATRNQLIPTLDYPVITDFNYVIVQLSIDGTTYFLDATDRDVPFGILPFRALNQRGRVFDLNAPGKWIDITPGSGNMHAAVLRLEAEEEGGFSAKISERSTGYMAISKRKQYRDKTEEESLTSKQNLIENAEVLDFTIENKDDTTLPFIENYTLVLEELGAASGSVFLYPFLMETFFTKNPFLQEERLYPIDFGYPILNNYLISIDLGDKYEVIRLPENRRILLPENDGELQATFEESGNTINIRLNFRINTYNYPPEAYRSLKEIFTELISVQASEPIELKLL